MTSTGTRRLLVATHNPGKIMEYRAILQDLPIEITWLDAEGIHEDVAETGATCTENALLKANAYAAMTGLWTWADDTGLMVEALDGRPGVHAARYAGAGASDRDRRAKLLRELDGIPPERWQASFLCVVALVEPGGESEVVEGRLDGKITPEERGEHGFGYDPIFYLPEFNCTLAELEPKVKNSISHRARAAALARARIAARLNGA